MKHRTTLFRHALLATLLTAGGLTAQAQNGVGIGTTAPDVSAALDIVSTSKGALLPRVASTASVPTPATGLIVFQTGGTAGYYYNAGTPGAPSWQQIATASGAAITASNGLTKTGQNIALGGTLTGATTIANAGFALNVTGTGTTSFGGNVGIGATAPGTQLSNTSSNVLGSDANGTSTQSIGWVTSTGGYAAAVASSAPDGFGNNNGLAVKVVGTSGTALDISSGPLLTTGTPLLRVTGGGSVGIGLTTPTALLDVNGSTRLRGLTTAGVVTTDASGNLSSSSATTAFGTSFIQNQNTADQAANFRINGTGSVGSLQAIGATAATQTISTQGAYLQWNRSANDGETWLLNQLGGGTANAGIRFGSATTANVVTEWARFLNNGNFGIGTTAPTARLHTRGTGNAFPATTGTAQSVGLISRFQTSDNAILDLGGNSGNGFWLQSTDITALNLNYPLLLNPNGGNVGIGTTAPLAKFAIAGGAQVMYAGLNNASARPAVGTARIAGEIGAVGQVATATPDLTADDGFLRLSAGGGGTLARKSYIDLSGFSNNADMNENITFGTINAERMRITNSGNVGIGTTAPNAALQVTATSLPTLLLQNPTGGVGATAALDFLTFTAPNPANPNSARLSAIDDGGASAHLAFSTRTTGSNANPLVERMRLTSTGNVGIGTITPTQALDVNGGIAARTFNTITNQGAHLQWNRTGFEGETWLINSIPASNAQNFGIRFGNADPATNIVTEWARFSRNGNFSIGVPFASGQGAGAYKLEVNGDINAIGNVRSNGTALTSDRRLKRNINPSAFGLATVLSLRPVQYEKKASIQSTVYDRHEIGFIAQELQQLLPTLVSEGKDADKTLAVSYTELIPVLTKAIQEQQAQIEALKARNASLEGRAAQADADHASLLTLQAQMARLLGDTAPANAQARK